MLDLQGALDESGMKITELSRKSGVPDSTLRYAIMRGGCSSSTVQKLERALGRKIKVLQDTGEDRKNRFREMDTRPSNSICWRCKRSLLTKDGCDWAWEQKPIPWWTAERRTYRDYTKKSGEYTTYSVQKCPQFLPDEPRKKGEMIYA